MSLAVARASRVSGLKHPKDPSVPWATPLHVRWRREVWELPACSFGTAFSLPRLGSHFWFLSEKHGWGAELLQVVMVDSFVAEIVLPFQQLLAFDLFVAQRADATRAGRKGLPVYIYRLVYDQHHPRRFSVQSSKKIFSMYDRAASTPTPRGSVGRIRQESGPECIRHVLHVLRLQGSSFAAAGAGPTGAAAGPRGVQQQAPSPAAAGAGPTGAADGPSGVQQLEAHIDRMHSATTDELDMAIVERAAAELVNPNGFEDLELELARIIEEDEARTGEMIEEALIHTCVARGDISSEQLDRLVASASEVFMSWVKKLNLKVLSVRSRVLTAMSVISRILQALSVRSRVLTAMSVSNRFGKHCPSGVGSLKSGLVACVAESSDVGYNNKQKHMRWTLQWTRSPMS